MRATTAAVALVALLGAVALAGCADPSSPVEVRPYLDLVDAAPGRPVPVPLHLTSTLAFKQRLGVDAEGLPFGWRFDPESESVEIPGRARMPFVVNVTPAADARVGLHAFDVKVGETRARIQLNVAPPGPERLDGNETARVSLLAWHANGSIAQETMGAREDVPRANETLLVVENATEGLLVRAENGTLRGLPSTLATALLGAAERELRLAVVPRADVGLPGEGALVLLVRVDRMGS